MTKTNGLEYMDTPIDNSGVIPLSELGIGNWREDVSYNPLYIEKQNRTYRTNIGDRVNTHDITSGISDLGSMSPEELSNALYKTQTGIEMAANALKGMAAIAGTTYVSNTLGLGNMLLEGTWDNTVNNYMAELEQEARERNQIYRPTDYDEWSLMQKLGNGVFWADLIQNFGFTVGAGAAAATWAAIPGVGALMSKAPKIVQMAVPSLLSSAGEASIEAIHHKNDETQRKQQTALQAYTKDLNNALTKDAADEITSQFQKTIFDIEEDERKAGNFIFGANLALLTASNTIQFGDIFSRGFSTGRRIANSGKRAINSVAGEAPEQLAKESVGWAGVKGTAKGLVSQLSEASEEVSQGIIQKAASLNEDYDSFNGSKFNPEKREEVSGIMQSLIAASAEAMHDPNTAVEAAMGFLTGALGMPRLKKSIMPVKLEGGIVGSVLEEVNKTKSLNNTIDLINAKLADSKTTNDYYEGLVRHLAYQDKEDLALEEGNHKKFADANSAKFISDVVMFDRVGRLDLLENIINTAGSLSDEDITSLIEETSKNGNGAFSQNGNPMGISEVRSILSDRTKSLKEKITEYKDAKDKLLVDFPSLNEDSLEEALFYKMQTSDLERRNVSMGKELYNIIKSVAQKEAYLKTEDNVGLASVVGGATESTIWNKLYSNNKELLSKLNETVANPAYNVTLDTINQIQNLIDDHAANNEDIFNYVSSFNELISNPNKANKKHEAFKSKLANKEKAAEIRNQKVATVETVQNTNTGELAEGILDGSFDFDSALSAIHDVGAESSTSTTQKLEEAKNIANAARNQIGTSTKQGLIDKVEGGSKEAKADAKSFVLYATKNVGIRRDLLNTSTYANMTLTQIAEALGLDVNTLSPQDLENLEETLEARSIAALDVLRQSLEIGNAHIEEAEGMAISITPPTETPTVSRSEITPVQSVPNNDKRFKTGKKILGVDVGGMTVKEAREALQYHRTLEQSEKDGIKITKIVDYRRGKRMNSTHGTLIKRSDIIDDDIPQGFDGSIRGVEFREDKDGNVASSVIFIPKTGDKFTGEVRFKNNKAYNQILTSQGNPQEMIEHQESILKEMMDDKDNDYTPSRTESTPSTTSTKPISGTWTPGYPYFYRGEDPKYKGLTSSQIIENKIQTLRSSDSLTSKQETDLSLLEKEAEIRNFLEIDNRVATVTRQAKVQVGTKLNFMVKPEFPTTVFITVLDEGGNHTIVGALGPSQAPSVLRRYRKKGTPATTYIESNVSEVTKKYIGSLNYRTTKIPLSEITKEKFKLAVDLSSEGDEYADIRTLADSRKETKTESERNIRPPKKGKAGADYVLVKTSLKGEGEYITAGLDSIFYKADDNVAPAVFLRDVQNAVIPLERKLALIQEILNIDIKPNGISMTTEGGQVSYLVRSKGKGQNEERTIYGTISGDPASIVSQILDLVSGKVKYTVSRKYINSTIDGRDYNQMMASVLITNLNSLETLGDFFSMKSVFEDGTPTVGKELDRIKPVKSNASITLSGNDIQIIKQNVTYIVNTEQWTVSKVLNDNKLQVLDSATSVARSLMAEAYANKTENSNIIQNTPWGLYHLSSQQFIQLDASSIVKVLPILEKSFVEKASVKIQALIEYDNLRSTIYSPELDKYMQEVKERVEKRYTYYTSGMLESVYMAEQGQGPTVEVIRYVEDPNLAFGESKIITIQNTAIFDKQDNLLQPAQVIIARHSVAPTSTTTDYTIDETPTEEERQIVNRIKDCGLMPVYKALSPEVQKQFIDYLIPKASAIRTRFINQKLGEAKAKSKDEVDDFILASITPKKAKLRIASNSTIPSLNIDEEVAWIEKALPQVSREDRMRIVKGLIKIAHKDTTETAWGMFKDGLIYISDNAASGTVYHEAFHLVVDTLLNKKETKRLFEEAKKIYKSDDLLELEERMAEDFRKYVSYNITEQKGWLKSLWEKLKHLIKYLSGKLTYLDHIYFNIHNGVYKQRKVKDFLEARYRKLTSDDLLSTNDAITSRRIINAHTINKTLSDRAKAVMKNKNAKALYPYSDLESMFAHIPNYQEVVRFVEYRGKYKPEFYFDLATKTAVKEAINLTEEILSEEENGKYDISITEYLAERARLEAELTKYTEEEKEYESYEEQLFGEREQRLEVKLSFDNLSEDIKSLIQNTKKLTSAEYSALSTAEKAVLLHCLGL